MVGKNYSIQDLLIQFVRLVDDFNFIVSRTQLRSWFVEMSKRGLFNKIVTWKVIKTELLLQINKSQLYFY